MHLLPFKRASHKAVLQRYSLVNWQQGCGKTVVSFLYGKMLLDNQKVRNVIVVAPAVATNLTWSEFLTVQGVAFRNINRKDEINTAQPGEFLILSTSMLGKRKRELRQFLRLTARKHCLFLMNQTKSPMRPASGHGIC